MLSTYALGESALGEAAPAASTAPADTTAPVFTGSVTVTAVTATGGHAAWGAATDNVAVAGYELSCDTGTPVWIDVGSNRSADISGKTAATAYTVRVRAYDAAGNRSSALTAVLTTSAAADTTAPTLSGSVVITAVTSSGAHAAWSAATDNVGVAGYEVSVDTGTPVWMDVGNVTSCDVSGESASTTYTFRLRAYDAAGNRSSTITGTFSTAAAPVVTGPITVPASRTATFAANARVAVFSSGAPVKLKKGVLDEVWLVGDITKDLTDSATTAVSVVAVSAGVTILVAPAFQGSLITVKVGAIDLAILGPYITFRVTDANDQQFDRTILLLVADDRSVVFAKDPDDRRYFAYDFTADLALSAGAKLLSAQFQTPAGVSTVSAPVVQGKQVLAKIAGLATADGAANSCPVAATFDNGEKLYRTMYFTREDH